MRLGVEIRGERCTLRSVAAEDIDTMLVWENDPEVREFGDAEKIFTRSDMAEFVRNQRCGLAANGQQRLMIIAPDGRTVGAIDLFDFDGRQAMVGILVYAHADRRRGYGSDALRTIGGYARDAGVAMLYADVAATNTASLRLFASCGFVRTEESGETVRFEKML